MAKQRQATIQEIINTLIEKLVDDEVLGLTADHKMLLIARDDIQHTYGDHDILIRPRSQTPEESKSGGGHYGGVTVKVIEVTVRARKVVDDAADNEKWLEMIFAYENQILDSLDLFYPEATNQDILTTEPIRHLKVSDESKDKGDNTGWGRVVIPFEVKYVPILTRNN